MTRETPICHRLMAAMYTGSDPDCPWPSADDLGDYARCIGSRCALWVPADTDRNAHTGLGSCSDNRRDHYPWPDPAAKGAP